jgi:hypothetical protein
MVLTRSFVGGVGAALLSFALIRCAAPSAPNPPASQSLTPAAASTTGPAPSCTDSNEADGGVECAYQAYERGDGAAFLGALDPAVRDQPGLMKFGNLLILDITGLSSDLSRTTFRAMHYSVLSTDGEWAEVGVQGIARSVALDKEAPIAGVEIARQIQGRWLLSTTRARATAQVDRALESVRAHPDMAKEGGHPAAAPQPGPEPPYWRVVGEEGANLREAPSRTANIVRDLPKAEVVTNLDQEATVEGLTWRRVAYGPVEGWVAAALLAPQLD